MTIYIYLSRLRSRYADHTLTSRAIFWSYDFAGPGCRRQIADKFAICQDRSAPVVDTAWQQYDARTAIAWVARCSQLGRRKMKGTHLHGCRKMAVQLPYKFASCRKAVVRIRKTFLRPPYDTQYFARQPYECLTLFVRSSYELARSEGINARGSANSCHFSS